MSQKKKERNEISLATPPSSEGWADGEVCKGGGESGEGLGFGEEGGLRSSGKEGRQSAENRGESRTEHCGSQSTVTYGVRFESLGKTRLLKIYSAGGTKNSGGHTFLI